MDFWDYRDKTEEQYETIKRQKENRERRQASSTGPRERRKDDIKFAIHFARKTSLTGKKTLEASGGEVHSAHGVPHCGGTRLTL